MWCMALSVSVLWFSPLHKYMQHRLPFTIQLTFSPANDAKGAQHEPSQGGTLLLLLYSLDGEKFTHFIFRFVSFRFVSSCYSFIVGVLLSVLLFSVQSTRWVEWVCKWVRVRDVKNEITRTIVHRKCHPHWKREKTNDKFRALILIHFFPTPSTPFFRHLYHCRSYISFICRLTFLNTTSISFRWELDWESKMKKERKEERNNNLICI